MGTLSKLFLLALAAAAAFSLAQSVEAKPRPFWSTNYSECSRWRLDNFSAWFRFARRGCLAVEIESLIDKIEHFDLGLFRRDIEPMARRLIQLCGPDWFCNLL